MREHRIGLIGAIENEDVREGPVPAFLTAEETEAAWAFHHALDGYAPTPLVRLDGLARKLGVRAVFVKDESHRFGLDAFKGLGGSYAVVRAACRALGLDPAGIRLADLQAPAHRAALDRLTFVTATDGNHGRGVAWAARLLGCRCHVYLPAGSVEARAQAIRDAGAEEARILDVGYDDAVRYAARCAEERGWLLIQDTSWPGYTEVPTWIVQGYATMAREAAEQLAAEGFDRPTHVFLQAGVGAMAGGVTGALADRWAGDRPTFAVVEPETVACIYASARHADGAPWPAEGPGGTIMAGLDCAEPCTLTWPVLRDLARWYLTCPDFVTEAGMRLLASRTGGDPAVVSGESGAVTTGLLSLVMLGQGYAELRIRMGLDRSSVVLLFSTEGATDPAHYAEVVGPQG